VFSLPRTGGTALARVQNCDSRRRAEGLGRSSCGIRGCAMKVNCIHQRMSWQCPALEVELVDRGVGG